jgi:hypothetical protein
MVVEGRPWLVLKLDNHRPWLRGNSGPDDISDVFGKDGADDISVFEVSAALHEARIAAALWSMAGSSAKDPLYLLRMPIELVGIDVLQTEGATWIPSVNNLHRDLRATGEAFEHLAHYLLHRVSCGDAIVRGVHGHGLGTRVREFLDTDDVIAEKRRHVATRLTHAMTKEWQGGPVACPSSWASTNVALRL